MFAIFLVLIIGHSIKRLFETMAEIVKRSWRASPGLRGSFQRLDPR